MLDVVLVVAVAVLLVIIVRVLVRERRLEASIPDLCDEAVAEWKKRSGRVRVGTTVEQLVPFMETFPYDPSDMRLISGGPIDYVVFDGLTEGRIRRLVFLDVKTGNARVKEQSQKQAKLCVARNEVDFEIFQIESTGNTSTKRARRVDATLERVNDL
jgi:predicted Holliday junction resolvase-like endonuclease